MKDGGWYVVSAGFRVGPFRTPDIERLVDNGSLGLGSLLLRAGTEGDAEPQRVVDHPEFDERDLRWAFDAPPAAASVDDRFVHLAVGIFLVVALYGAVVKTLELWEDPLSVVFFGGFIYGALAVWMRDGLHRQRQQGQAPGGVSRYLPFWIWFVPVLNLYGPVALMLAIAKGGSQPLSRGWQAVVWVWWTAFLLSLVAPHVGSAWGMDSRWVSAVVFLLQATSCMSLSSVVWMVSRMGNGRSG